MPTVEQLLKQHDMGQAYVQITDELGPDPQLVAFVNYDSFAGFESLDMFSQHLEILDQIKNDESFNLAKQMVVADSSPNSTKELPDSIIGIEGFLGKFFKKPSPPTYQEFLNFKGFHQHTCQYITTVLNKVPKTYELGPWQEWQQHVEKTQDAYIDQLLTDGSAKDDRSDDDKKAASKEGWTQANYHSAMSWTDGALKESEEVVKHHQEKLNATKEWVKNSSSKDKADDAKIIAIIDKSLKLFYGMDSTGAGSAHQCKELLEKVGSHLEQNDKDK